MHVLKCMCVCDSDRHINIKTLYMHITNKAFALQK